MTTLEQSLYAFLIADAGLTPILGAGDDARVYPKRLPQEPTLPALVYQMVSSVPNYTTDQAGDPPSATAFVKERVQFDLWAAIYEDLLPLKSALFAGISGFRGTMDTMKIESAFVVNEVDLFEPDTGYSRKVVDVIFSFEEQP